MGDSRIQTRRNQTNAKKVTRAQDYHVRMKNKKKYHKGKQRQKLERKPNKSAVFFMRLNEQISCDRFICEYHYSGMASIQVGPNTLYW